MGAGLGGVLLGGWAVWSGMNPIGAQADSGRAPPTPGVLASANSEGPDPAMQREPTLADAVDATDDSVVSLEVGGVLEGAGVVVDREGLVFTNFHVIARAVEQTKLGGTEGDPTHAPVISARFRNGRMVNGEVVAADRGEDIAVLRLQNANGTQVFEAASLGRSSALRVGDDVFAVGCPFGLEHTVSSGIVSALNRTDVLANRELALIQLDASINLGNSGGPLFNRRGELVGITTARLARGEGIAFAIPIDRVRAFLAMLAQGGEDVSGVIGLVLVPSAPVAALLEGTQYSTGVLIAETPDGPAKRAGLRVGDVMVEVRSKRLDEYGVDEEGRTQAAMHLGRVVHGLLPGEHLKLMVVRGGEAIEFDLAVSAAPAARQVRIDAERLLGLVFREGVDALEVSAIDKSSRAGQLPGSESLVGCTLTHVLGRPVADDEALRKRLATLRRWTRDGVEREVSLAFHCRERTVLARRFPLTVR